MYKANILANLPIFNCGLLQLSHNILNVYVLLRYVNFVDHITCKRIMFVYT